MALNRGWVEKIRFSADKSPYLGQGESIGLKLPLITYSKSHEPFQITWISSILDDLEGSLRTLLCQSCGIVAKMYVGLRRMELAMVPLDRTKISFYRLSIVTTCLHLQRFGHSFECKVDACSYRTRAQNYHIVF